MVRNFIKITLLFLATCVNFIVYGEEITFDYGELKYRTVGTTAVVVGPANHRNKDNLVRVNVPAGVVYGGYAYSVVAIDDYAFQDFINIADISIASNVTSIREGAFAWCTGLKKLNLDETKIETIGKRAFIGCQNIAEISLPKTLKYIGEEAFMLCYSLISLSIPSSVRTIEGKAFYSCTLLTTVVLNPKELSLGAMALRGCPNISEVTIYSAGYDMPGNDNPTQDQYVFDTQVHNNAMLCLCFNVTGSASPFKSGSEWRLFV